MSLYATEPQNLTLAQVDQRIREALQSPSSRGSYVPRGIPQISVDIPIVTNLPLGAQDGSEVYLRVGDGNRVAQMLYLASIPGWVQTGIPPTVTSLPTANLMAGMQVIYDTGTSGVRWHLTYDTSDGTTYPWLFVGGSALINENAAGVTTTSATYVDSGATLTCPLKGEYVIEVAVHGAIAAAETAWVSPSFGATAVDADGELLYASSANIDALLSRRRVKAIAAAATVKAQVRMGAVAIARPFTKAVVSITPRRVGA